MKEKLDCEIVRDLMPLYAENLESEKTKAAVEEHVENCPSCREILLSMKAPEYRKGEGETPEIDYLKKLKKNSKKGVLVAVFSILSVLLLAFAIGCFYPGHARYYENIESEVTVSENAVKISASALGEKECITKIKAKEKDGEVYLSVYCAPKSFFGRKSKKAEYIGEEKIKTVLINGNVAWEDGYYTNSTEYKLWKNKTPYCGDITANLKIAEAVGVYKEFGSFTNGLSTVKEPYGWRIFLKNPIEKENEAAAKKSMKSKASAILSSIGNLGFVTFVYDVDGTEKRFSVTEKQASEYVGKNIKLCSGSIEEIRELLNRLEIE